MSRNESTQLGASIRHTGQGMGLAEDLENYRYPEHKEGKDLREIPIKDGYHDHGCDMLRYFMLNRFPIKQQGIKFVDRKKEGNQWHNTLKI